MVSQNKTNERYRSIKACKYINVIIVRVIIGNCTHCQLNANYKSKLSFLYLYSPGIVVKQKRSVQPFFITMKVMLHLHYTIFTSVSLSLLFSLIYPKVARPQVSNHYVHKIHYDFSYSQASALQLYLSIRYFQYDFLIPNIYFQPRFTKNFYPSTSKYRFLIYEYLADGFVDQCDLVCERFSLNT